MKTIIAGSRDITDYDYLKEIIKLVPWDITEVVSGAARGVDTLGELYAAENNIPCVRFPAKWDELGKKAGIIRNCEMAAYADALITLWDGLSKGSAHMLKEAKRKKLFIYLSTPSYRGFL